MDNIVKATLEDLKMEKWLRMRDSGQLAWETRNGKIILLRNLSDSHLDNIISYLEKEEVKLDAAAGFLSEQS